MNAPADETGTRAVASSQGVGIYVKYGSNLCGISRSCALRAWDGSRSAAIAAVKLRLRVDVRSHTNKLNQRRRKAKTYV